VTPVISHRFPLNRAAQALAVAADPTSASSKVMLRLADMPPGS
jgi:L-idonate 5-dehydrogenase